MTTQLDETGHVEIILSDCHWCGEPLDESGKDGMHERCVKEFTVEWDPIVNDGGQSIQRIEE